MRLLFYYQILQYYIQFSKEIHCNGERLKCFLNILLSVPCSTMNLIQKKKPFILHINRVLTILLV